MQRLFQTAGAILAGQGSVRSMAGSAPMTINPKTKPRSFSVSTTGASSMGRPAVSALLNSEGGAALWRDAPVPRAHGATIPGRAAAAHASAQSDVAGWMGSSVVGRRAW
jgi:hypothetical protein